MVLAVEIWPGAEGEGNRRSEICNFRGGGRDKALEPQINTDTDWEQ